jgi:hypothetical protein
MISLRATSALSSSSDIVPPTIVVESNAAASSCIGSISRKPISLATTVIGTTLPIVAMKSNVPSPRACLTAVADNVRMSSSRVRMRRATNSGRPRADASYALEGRRPPASAGSSSIEGVNMVVSPRSTAISPAH